MKFKKNKTKSPSRLKSKGFTIEITEDCYFGNFISINCSQINWKD